MGKKNVNKAAKNEASDKPANGGGSSMNNEDSSANNESSSASDGGSVGVKLNKDGTVAQKRGPKPRTPEERAALKLRKAEEEKAKLARLEARAKEQREKLLSREIKREKQMKQAEESAREAIGAVEVHVEAAAEAAMKFLREDGSVDFEKIAEEPIFSYPWSDLALAYASHKNFLEYALASSEHLKLNVAQYLVYLSVEENKKQKIQAAALSLPTKSDAVEE